MFPSLKFFNKQSVRCYFITGTGRCGTMLVSKLLSLGRNTHCCHERSIKYDKMKPAYLNNNLYPLYEEIDKVINPLILKNNKRGMSYGESSGLLYLTFQELYNRYKSEARFVLLTRHPASYVRSALARGFFDPEHPYPLEHIRARKNTEIGQQWEHISPFEKCLWYWHTVNSMVYNFFCTIPGNLWRIQPIEKISVSECYDLYRFLGIDGVDESSITEILSIRINSAVGSGDERWVNPYTRPVQLNERSSWELNQKHSYDKWARPLLNIFYPESEE